MKSTTPTFDLELLREHSDWVRALARSLLRDPEAAEDIEQETWVAALRTPPDRSRSVRAWLGAVARNLARQHVRARERRARRERLAAREEALPSDQELDERVALQRWVVEQVMALDEPYRRTILLRFFEGLPPREIAVRMGVPLETVKTRSTRALLRLRTRLSVQRGPNGACGVASLMPLVLSSTSKLATGSGLALMGKKSLLVLASLVLLSSSVALYMDWSPASDAPGSASDADLRGAEVVAADELGRDLALAPEVALESRSLERRNSSSAEESLLCLRTIAGEGGSPLAEVQIFLGQAAHLLELSASSGFGESFDIEAVLSVAGRSVRSDERGEARLALPEGYSVAVARRGDLFGQVFFVPKVGQTVDIPLRPDRSLTIETVTAAGEPISGIPVGLAPYDAARNPSLFWWARTSGAEGRVTVHHVDQVLKPFLQPGSTWTATLASPWPDPPSVHLDPRELPTEPVRLVVARGGRVVVRVADERGEPCADTWVHLAPVGEDWDVLGRLARPRRHDLLARSGIAVFENVAPGLALRGEVSPSTHRPVEKSFAGPARPGDEVVVELRLGERYPTFAGTLVDAMGAALADRSMILRARGEAAPGEFHVESATFRTDGKGHFRTSLATRSPDFLLREVDVTTDGSYAGEALSARVVLEEARSRGDIDLSRVVLEPPPVMLSGRVVDSRGEPIHWAGILVKRLAAPGATNGPPYEWVDAWQQSTQEDGSFQLNGDQGLGEYRLCISKPGYLSREDVPFRLGTRDLEVVLQRSAGLQGRLRLREDVPPGWLRVRASRDGGGGPLEHEAPRPKPDGSFFLLDLAPGEVDVTVSVPAWPEPLARVASVRVEGEGPRADPRLDLDLRDAIHRIDLELRDREGDAVPIGCVVLDHPAGGRSRTAFTDGKVAMLAPAALVDIEILAPGFRPQRVRGADDGREIVLERGIRVRVKLADDFELPDLPVSLSVQLVPVRMDDLDPRASVHADDGTVSSSWGRQHYGVTATFDETREQKLAVGSPGSWQVFWQLRSERSRGGVESAAGSLPILEVDESDPDQLFVLSPDAKAVREWIARTR